MARIVYDVSSWNLVKAALSVLADAASSLASLIQPLAAIRNISVLEMAQLILAKSEVANQKIMELEAIEDEYQEAIKNAETLEQINQTLNEIATALNEEKE